MDMRIHELLHAAPVENKTPNVSGDETFRFSLISNIEESDLQAKLSGLMNEISQQGKKIAKHTDIRDMRRYRELVKSFLNEVEIGRAHV